MHIWYFGCSILVRFLLRRFSVCSSLISLCLHVMCFEYYNGKHSAIKTDKMSRGISAFSAITFGSLIINVRVFPRHWEQGLTFTCSNTWTESLSNFREYCCTCKHSHWPQPLPLPSLTIVLRLAVCFKQNQIWQVCRCKTVSLETKKHKILVWFPRLVSWTSWVSHYTRTLGHFYFSYDFVPPEL